MRKSVRSVITIATLFLAASPLGAHGGQSDTATPETRTLAAEVVRIGGDRERMAGQLRPLETMLEQTIVSTLGANDDATKSKVDGIVRGGLVSLEGKAVEAEANAYAAHFSAAELRDVLAFMNGPGGRAEAANLPLMKHDLGPALTMVDADAAKTIQDAEAAFAKATPARRTLIRRIFAAQKTEAHIREDHEALLATMASAMNSASGSAGRGADSAPETPKEAHDLDAYVHLVMAIETRFYVQHYSDAELEGIAAYLESETGQAVIDRLPLIRRAIGQAMQTQLNSFLPIADAPICAAVSCSPEQRAALKVRARGLLDVMSAMLRTSPLFRI
jgi:hypothetical protein